MGTWNTKIKGNDTTLDIYSSFFEKYNNGGNQVWVSNQIKKEFANYFSDSDDRNNSLFGLALAQWETKSLEPEILFMIKEIIDNGIDLELWKELGADEKTVQERKTELQNFLKLISTEKPKAKRRVRPKLEFTTNEIIRISTANGTKEFRVNEEFTNGKYIHTSGIMEWNSGGGAEIIYFNGESKKVSAKWIDSQTLEITHEKGLVFINKEEQTFFYGDEVMIKYIEE